VAGHDRLGVVREREGNRLGTSAPLDNYPTADGRYVCLVAGSDTNYARLCRAMDRPDLVDDPRFATLSERAARSDEINGIVADWTGIGAVQPSSRRPAWMSSGNAANRLAVGAASGAAEGSED